MGYTDRYGITISEREVLVIHKAHFYRLPCWLVSLAAILHTSHSAHFGPQRISLFISCLRVANDYPLLLQCKKDWCFRKMVLGMELLPGNCYKLTVDSCFSRGAFLAHFFNSRLINPFLISSSATIRFGTQLAHDISIYLGTGSMST